MLPYFIGLAVVSAGLYLIGENETKNTNIKNRYKKVKSESARKIKKHYYNAEKTVKRDQLYKLRSLKKQTANDIYNRYKDVKENFANINLQLKELKYTLDELFKEKRRKQTAKEKKLVQTNINIVILSRKELFKIKENIQKNLIFLKDKLKVANLEITNINQKIKALS